MVHAGHLIGQPGFAAVRAQGVQIGTLTVVAAEQKCLHPLPVAVDAKTAEGALAAAGAEGVDARVKVGRLRVVAQRLQGTRLVACNPVLDDAWVIVYFGQVVVA